MYQDTVTIFNRKRGRDGDTWYPTVLTGVNLNIDKGAIAKVYGSEAQDNAVLNVRYKNSNGVWTVGEKVWLPPIEYQRSNAPADHITFTAGAAFDFFWAGEWEGTTPLYDDNYGDMSFYDYMLGNYDFVYAITSVGLFSVIPHMEVLAK